MRTLFVLIVILVPITAECSSDSQLEPVAYHGTTSVTSQKKAEVELVTGEVKRHRVDEDVLPTFITKGSWESRHPNLDGTFDAEDQQVFVQSFMSELVRLSLFKQATTTGEGRTEGFVHIKLRFAKTDYLHAAQRYVLYVEMEIESKRGVSAKRYVADSKDSVPFLKHAFTFISRKQAKATVAADLMGKLVPDVEEWLKHDEPAGGASPAQIDPPGN